MTKIVLVPDKNNLGASFSKAGYVFHDVSLDSFSVATILSIGTPEEIPLILLTYAPYTSSHAAICKELNTLGYIVGQITTNGNAKAETCVLYNMGLLTGFYNSRAAYRSMYANSSGFFKLTNPVSDGYIPFTFSHQYQTTLNPSLMHKDGIVISYNDVNRTKVSACYFPTGTYVNDAFTLSVPVLFLGFLYPTNVIAESTLIIDIVNFCKNNIFKPYKIEGYVKDMGKNPLQRIVRAHYHSDGSFAGETTSIEDGSYILELLNSDPVYVVCLAENSSKSSMVHSYVVPQENIKVVE